MSPAFGDTDNDGDLDLVIGRIEGDVKFYYENTGSASNPSYTLRLGTPNPFAGIDVGFNSAPAFVDVDNDGDMDLVIGKKSGSLAHYENTAGVFTQIYPDSPLGHVFAGSRSAPAFVDVDNDGDLDLVVGRGDGLVSYYKNTGSASNPKYDEKKFYPDNPFHDIEDVGSNSFPAFVDTDNDGDMDLVIGRSEGDLTFYYENTGSWDAATPPVFTPSYTRREGALNPFHDIDEGSFPAFVDTDNDGDLDLVIGRVEGDLQFYYENIGDPLSTNGVVAGFKAARYSMSGTDLLTALSAKQGSSC